MKKRNMVLVGLFLAFVLYSVFALYYNDLQSKKNQEELDKIKAEKAKQPQQYDATGAPIVGPLTNDFELSTNTKGKIPSPIESVIGFIGFFTNFVAVRKPTV